MNRVTSHENSVHEYRDIRVTSHENSIHEYCDIRVTSHENSVHEYRDIRVTSHENSIHEYRGIRVTSHQNSVHEYHDIRVTSHQNTMISHQNSVHEYCDIRVTSHENSVHEYRDIRVSQSVIDLTVVLESFTQMCRSTILPLKLWSLVTWTSNSSEFPYSIEQHGPNSRQLGTMYANNDCLPASLKYPRNVLESGERNLLTSQLQMNHPCSKWSPLVIGLIPMCSQAHLGTRLP